MHDTEDRIAGGSLRFELPVPWFSPCPQAWSRGLIPKIAWPLCAALQNFPNPSRDDLGLARLHHPHGNLDAFGGSRPQLDGRIAFPQLLDDLLRCHLHLALI